MKKTRKNCVFQAVEKVVLPQAKMYNVIQSHKQNKQSQILNGFGSVACLDVKHLCREFFADAQNDRQECPFQTFFLPLLLFICV